MGTWISKERADKRRDDEQSLRKALIDLGLREVKPDKEDRTWGVSVSRETRIKSFNPTPGEPEDGYVYGHRKDFEAIKTLEVPDDLKDLIASLVDSWHKAKETDDLDARIAKIRGVL